MHGQGLVEGVRATRHVVKRELDLVSDGKLAAHVRGEVCVGAAIVTCGVSRCPNDVRVVVVHVYGCVVVWSHDYDGIVPYFAPLSARVRCFSRQLERRRWGFS